MGGSTLKGDGGKEHAMKCSQHPRYKGARAPTSECPECWGIWHLKQGGLDSDVEIRKKSVVLNATQKKYKEALDQIEHLERELNASKAIKSVTSVRVPARKKNERSEAVPIILAGDWHIEERVNKAQVEVNEFTLDIAKYRVEKLFQRAVRLIEIYSEHSTIHRGVVCMLGDMFSGNIHEELMENCSLPPIEAAMYAQNLFVGGLEYLLKETKLDYNVVCHSGNHARITKGRRFSTEKGNSLEYMLYHNVAEHFADEKRLKFVIPEGYHAYFDIGGFVLRSHHGHAFRYNGGVGGPSIPIRKKIAQWNKLRKADLDVFGHLHSHLPNWDFVMNGSVIGYNDFALFYGFDYQPPSQSFILIDLKRRLRSVVAPIWLD